MPLAKGSFLFVKFFINMKTQIKPIFDLEKKKEKKYFGKFKKPLTPIPSLVQPQLDSFKWLLEHGIAEVY